MDRFEQFKSKFPEFSNLSNGEIVNLVSQYTGADPQRVYSEFGGEQNRSAVGDLGTALKIGVQRLPETVTGLGDVLVAPITGRASISDAADSLGRATGFRPGQWANDSQLNYSPAQQQFLQQGAQTEGFADTAAHYLTNPMRSVVQGVESVPGMALGGAYARGLRGLGGLSNAARFGAGEGGVMAGQAMNQMVEDGVDPRRAAGYAAGVGALGGALGYGGGRLAERLGVVNPDELLGFGGRTALAEGATAPGLGRRVAGGMLSEGAFEEMPQSAMEAAMGNLAAERPWDQDVGKQAAAGLVLGGLLGGVVGVVPPARNPADPIDILNRDTTPQSEAAPQVGQSELNFGVTGEEDIGTRGLRNPFDAAGYVSGFQQGQETTVDVPQSDLFGGTNDLPPVDIPRAPKINIPVPQSLQSDPVRSAVAQASPATLRKDGTLKDIVEKALGAYSEFSDWEIAAALEEFAASKRKDTVWRVAALEAIARQRAAQGAPNVAQVDAASGQGAGAVPAGSQGNTPDRVVDLGGVRQPAGAPAPGSAAGIPVGEPVVQQPSGVEDVINAVSPVEQVAPQATEARGQEGAQVEQTREPVVTAEELRIAQKRDADPTAPGAVKIIGSDGVERWVTPSTTKTAAKGKRAAGERVPFEQLRGTEQQMVRDFMGYDEFGEVSDETAPMSLRQMAPIYGMSHETLGKRLAALGYTNEAREQESAAEETFLTETAIGREDASPELSDEAIDIADVVGGNLRVQKGVGAKGDTGAGRGYQKLLTAGTRFDARRDGRPIWSEAAIAEAVASNALSDEQLVAAEKELAARAKREAAERAAKQSKRGERAAPAPRTQEQVAQEGRAVSRAQNQAEREARARAEREAAEREVQRRVAAEAALQREYATLLAMPEARKAASYWNRFADEGVLQFADLPQELQVEWVQRYIETLEELPADMRVPDAMEALQSATQQEFLNDDTYQQAADAVGEAVAGGDSAGAQNQSVEEGNRPDEVARADPREEVTSTNPLEARVAALRDLDLGEKQTARLDKLVARYQNREIDVGRLGEELQAMEEQAFPEDRGGNGMRYSRTTDTQGTTVEAVRSAINDIATPAGRRKVTVYQTADEAVQNGALNSKDAKGTQGWVDAKGNAFFIAGNIPNGSELAVVLHEIGAHLGIENLLTDKQYESLVKKIFAWAQSDANTQEARIARAALARVDAAKLENDADVAPEVIAYFVEEAVKAGVNPTAMQYKTELGRWFRTLWAAFKVALDRLGLINPDKLTAQNVVDLAYGAANLALTGDLDPAVEAAAVRYSKAADPQLTELAQESGQRALKAIQAGIRKGWTGLAFSSHLTDAAVRAGLTSARALKLVQDKKQTAAYEIQIEVEKVLSKFASLEGKIGNDDAATVVQRFIYDSTFDQKWGFMPDWKEDATVDPETESRFKAIERANPQAAEVIKDVFRHGDAIFRKKQALLRKTITGEYEALIKAETDDGKRRKLERQRDKGLREAGKLLTALRGPYSPLRSYGDYVVIAKSQKFRDAEAAGPVDPELKRDRRHYVVDFARTLYEAEKLQADLEADFGKGMVWAGEKETATEQFGELPFMAVQRLRKMVDTDLDGDLNTKSKRVLNKLLVDLYISTLHEANARHSEQKRQFVNRATRDRAAQDMMRAFATQGRADSHLVSALQFNSEIVDKMQAMRDQAKQGGDSKLKTRLRNEILQRHMMDLDFRETPVQDKLMSLNSFWMLLTGPGYYVQNAFQVMMMTQPVLAGRFGQNRSMRQLMRGYQDAMRVLKGSSWNEAADLSRFNGTADEKAMLVELQARGTLDFGISAELGYWESRGEISKVFNQTMRKVGMATRKLEVMNRMTSALAAYRLMYERSSGTQTERHAAAVEYADSIINDTHGNYGTSNAPRYLRMLPKPMTQFRKFQLFQLSLFVKVIHGSVKGASPQEKRVMLATLGYLFMNHALLAGAVGIPAMSLLGALWAIAGDDDDPNDWEVDVRRAIGDKEMADLILHGLPSLININMSNKIGAGTMLDPLPFVEYEATRGGYEKAVTAAMGPLIGGLGAQAVDAFGRILKGDVAQGTAQLLPRGFRDAARGFMAAQDGIKLRNGQTALTPEELSFYDSLMMGLGLPTLKTTSRTETQFKSQKYETFFRERVTKLKRQYSEAYEENDREAMLEARQAWVEMQASRKNLGFKVQPLSDLLKAPREKAKAEAKLENGIRTTEQARGFVKSLQ